MRENEYLKKFVEEYESLACIQSTMRRRMDEIYEKEAAESKRKKIYDIVYMRLGMQAQYLELCRRDEEGEACPNCGVKEMRVRTRPRQPFWEVAKNAPPRP